jgi:hypothetical protein
MKVISFFIILIVLTLLNVACEKENSQVVINDETSKILNDSYADVKSQNRIKLALALVGAFSDNPQLIALTIRECNKMFDGDRNVLLSDLFPQPVNKLKSSGATFGKLIDGYFVGHSDL